MSISIVYSGSNRSFGGGGGGGGSVNDVTASAPLSSTGGTNPNISISLADSTTDGYLSSVDWNTFNNKQAALTPGTISTGTTGVTIISGANSTVGPNVVINIQTASGAQPGLLSAADWTTFNNKQNSLTIGNISAPGVDGIAITGGTGAIIGAGVSVAQQVANGSQNGYLSSTDWSTFNSKQAALTIGNLTAAGTDGISVTNGTGAVIGTGTSVQQQVANGSQNGYLSSTDWTTFNNKQAAGNYITALTGDVTATGPGSVAATIANSAVTNAKMANMANNTVKANKSGGAAAPSDLTLSDVVEAVSSILTITNGSKAVISSSNLSIEVAQSDSTTDGYLSSVDWNTFNNKQDAFTSQAANLFFASPNGAPGVPSFRAIVNADLPIVSIANGGTNSSTALNNNRVMQSSAGAIVEAAAITANRALISDANGIPTHSITTATELSYVNGATSNIQSQINAISAAVVSVGAFDGQAPTANGLAVASNVIYAQSADATHPGMVNNTAQTFSGVKTFNDDISMASNLISNLADPVSPQDAATKAYADALVNGLSWKTTVNSATTAALPAYTYANGTAGNGATITANANGALPAQDGVTLVVNDRLLVKNEAGADAPYNGIYVVTAVGDGSNPFVLTRSDDNNSLAEMTNATVQVDPDAATQGGYGFRQNTQDPVIGTDDIDFVNFNIGVSYVFTSGVQLSGNTVSANVDNSTLDINANQIRVANGGISNTQVNASAAIARTKLASGTAYRIIANNSSGVMSENAAITANRALASDANGQLVASATTDTELGYVNGVTSSIQTQLDGKQAAFSGLNTNGVIYATSATSISSTTVGTQYQLLVSNGVGNAPTYQAISLNQAAAVSGVLPNANTTATSANTASAIVARDGSGNFSAGTITASLTGTASGNTTYTPNNHGVVISSATNAMTVITPDASTDKVLVSGGASADPVWSLLTNSNLSGSAAISNANLASMAANTIKGNNTGGASTPLDLSVSQVQTMLSVPTSSSPLPLNAGGTGISAGSANAAFNALSPMTTLGDLIYGGTSGAATRLAGDTSDTRKFLRELSSGGVATAPVWDTLVAGDIPSLDAAKITTGVFPVARTTVSTQAVSGTSIDFSTGSLFTKTLSANTTFTFSNAISGQTIVIRLTNTASNYTVTWPTVRWVGGTPPTMSPGAVSDVYTILYDGSDYYGSYVQNMS